MRATDTDKLAPTIVRYWAELAALHGASDQKCGSAHALAYQMEQWPNRKFPK